MFIRVISIRKKLVALLLMTIAILIIATLVITKQNKSDLMIGAFIHAKEEDTRLNNSAQFWKDSWSVDERFQRPSKLPAIKLKYTFRPKSKKEVPPFIAEGFPDIYQSSQDVIEAYYAILKDAANMRGHYGGCGTIAWMDGPYPYAYRLLTEDTKNDISLDEFKDSFRGTGATNVLHITPAYIPANTPDNIMYYFVEVEVLKGYPYVEGKDHYELPNYFEYYYGIMTTEYNDKDGWRIKSVDYIPEIYLCHPTHGWSYDYDFFMGVVYNEWYGMNLTIDQEVNENNYIQVYASNEDDQYKFDFIKLSNGDDVLLHEYIKQNDRWKEVSILKPEHEVYYKISILKFKISISLYTNNVTTTIIEQYLAAYIL